MNKFIVPPSWCVRITGENRDIVRNYLRTQPNGVTIAGSYSWNTNAYYGVEDNGNAFGRSTAFTTVITFEEFRDNILNPAKSIFGLPEKWVIKLTEENKDIVGNWFDTNKQNTFPYHFSTKLKDGQPYLHYPAKDRNHSDYRTNNSYIEITLEQFKKYVLKQEIKAPVYEVLSKKANGHMISVANKEGNVIEIGDAVRTGKNTVGVVKSFKYGNKDKKYILAITQNGSYNINNIDHDLKGLGKLLKPIDNKLDFISEAKHRFPEGCVIRSVHDGSSRLIKDHSLIHANLKGDVVAYNNGETTLRTNDGRWADKISDESLLDKAERLYPVGTTIISCFGHRGTITEGSPRDLPDMGIFVYCSSTSRQIYSYRTGEWAKIIE